MSEFVLVVGLGHCGTRWLATVLDRPEQGVRFYHELKTGTFKYGWWPIKRRELAGEYDTPQHRRFYEQIKADLEAYRVVGDANSFEVQDVAAVNAIIPVSRVVCLLRDGILQLRSIGLRGRLDKTAKGGPLRFFAPWLERRTRDAWERFGGVDGLDYDDLDLWGKLCYLWASFPAVIEDAARSLPDIQFETHTLEGLTQDADELRGVLDGFGLEMDDVELREWQATDLHIHIRGHKDPTRVFYERLSREQRRVYRHICRATAERLGYGIPRRQAYNRGVLLARYEVKTWLRFGSEVVAPGAYHDLGGMDEAEIERLLESRQIVRNK